MSTNRPEVKTQPIVAGSRRPDPFFALLLLLALSLSVSTQAAVPQKLKDALASDSTKVRIIAVAGVAKSRDPEARALVEKLLKDPEASVRAAAADGLTAIKDPAALAALMGLKNDPDEGVRAVVGRGIVALEALLISVDIGDVEDLSGAGLSELLPQLQNGVDQELKRAQPGFAIRRGGVTKGYSLVLKIRSMKKYTQDGNGILEIKCDMTLIELPGKILRLTSSATAGAGVDGAIPKAMEKELAGDAIDACAPALAKDFIDYVQQHRGRKK